MKVYKVLTAWDPSSSYFEESINRCAEKGYVVKFLTQSEDSEHIHCTVLLEKEGG